MLSGRSVAVVVPAFDEARFIAATLESLPAFVDHVVVVDDASGDDTAARARAAGRAAHVISHASNRGVGAAIATGYARALELGADVVAVMAGDGQMHPDDLESLAAPVARGDADYAKGNRFATPGFWRVMPPHRAFGSAALAWLTRHAAGLEALHDSQCGYTVIARAMLERLDLDALWPSYGYPNDLLGALARASARVVEVPVRPVYGAEASGLRPRHALTIGFVVARVAWRRLAARVG